MTVLESQKATINDVASAAGVSKKTVSRVINSEPNVRSETRARVQQVMAELDYYPNFSARSLASKRSYMVVMLYCNQGAYFLQEIQAGLLDSFETRNYSLLMQACEGDQQQILKMVEHKARYMNVDGFVLVPPVSSMEPVVTLLKSLGKPFIRISPCVSQDADSEVVCDDEQAAFDVTSHLITQGHRAIGFVRGKPECLSAKTRFDGYNRALQQHGLALNEAWICSGNYSFSSGVSAGEKLLGSTSRPTAIFCSNDDMAAGVLHVAHDLKISVPKDLAITGCDDSPIARQIWPAMTSIRQPNRQMADIAANRLLSKIAGDEEQPTAEALPCEVIFRSSTEGWGISVPISRLAERLVTRAADADLMKRAFQAIEA